MKKKNNDLFKDMKGFALGTAGMGIGVGVAGAAASQSGVPGLTSGLSTMTGFMPVIGTAVGGKTALKAVKKLKY